jgi:hypothetical protein
VEKDNRQSNIDLQTGVLTLAKDGSIEDRASTSRTTRASSRASASPGRRATASSCAAPTASRSTWKGPGPTCVCP